VLGEAVKEQLSEPPAGVLVLGLPRGGVPVAAEVADALGAALDVFVVRKLGTPGQPELAMGAIASGGVRVLNSRLLRELGITDTAIERVASRELQELERRERDYRDDRPLPELSGRTVVLVDDGLATGASARAAVTAVRQAGPARVVLAVPVGAPSACRLLEQVADEVVCPHVSDDFSSVGAHYGDFTQVEDEEVRRLLATR
jgi:putative phosphoribosyl transferase